MNILLTSAAAKIQLLEAFKAVAHARGGRLVAIDVDPLCCAAQFADDFVLAPYDSDTDYAEAILGLCEAHAIGLVIPTRDAELPLLAALAGDLAARGTVVAVSPLDALAVCQDKLAFHAFCTAHGFPVLPNLADADAWGAPMFIRHRRGKGPLTNLRIDGDEDIRRLFPDRSDYLVQRSLDGQEYSCDLLMDLEGRPLQCFVRERQRLVAGESWRTRSVDIPAISTLACALGETLSLRGHNLIQLFWSEEEGAHLTEVNARFGGASNLSIHGGLASPERLALLAEGKIEDACAPRPLQIGLTMLRYSQDMFRTL